MSELEMTYDISHLIQTSDFVETPRPREACLAKAPVPGRRRAGTWSEERSECPARRSHCVPMGPLLQAWRETCRTARDPAAEKQPTHAHVQTHPSVCAIFDWWHKWPSKRNYQGCIVNQQLCDISVSVQSGCEFMSKLWGSRHLQVWFSNSVGGPVPGGVCIFFVGRTSVLLVSTGSAYEPQIFI